MYKFEDIGDKGLKIILYLFNEKKANLSELLEKLHLGKSTLYRSLRYLDRYNLIVEEKVGYERILSLTEKGKKIAVHLMEIEKILSNQ